MTGEYRGVSKEEILDRIEKRGFECEDKYHGCGQTVILPLQEAFDLKDEDLFKATSGLGYGIGRMYAVCGALISGCLFLSLKNGRGYSDLEKPEDISTQILKAPYEIIGRLYKWFEQEYGSVICREVRKSILGVDLDPNVPWQARIIYGDGHPVHCSKIVGKAARKAAELMMEE